MSDLATSKVGALVSENIKTAHIFKKHGIDFCCGGGISVEDACKKNNVSLSAVIEDLNNMDHEVDRQLDYNSWPLDFLIDHILNIHHKYVLESLPVISEYAEKVASVHGHHYTEVLKIRDHFRGLNDELLSHLQKEEVVLFPYVKRLLQMKQSGQSVDRDFVESPIKVMQMEHDRAGVVLRELRKLSKNYMPPADACNTFRALYHKLQEFEADLHQHIHLENNILFPKAIELEESMKG
ncbi:MAG TPA: iron-sulfur cluster repair di-iron protein [Flavobacteriales bacterium]|nr:iron-sulfur cluster repair di-iron protein [Flavobacteriales bacterium]